MGIYSYTEGTIDEKNEDSFHEKRPVEDEIEEFENKRKNNVKTIENDVETTETHIVNNVKNVQFQSCIVTHQKLKGEYNEDDIYESLNEDFSHNSTGNESLLSSKE